MHWLYLVTLVIVLVAFEWRAIRAERERERLYTRIMCRDINEYQAIASKPPAGRSPIADKLREYAQSMQRKEE